MSTLQVNDSRVRGRSKSPGGRIRERSRSRDDRVPSRSPAPSSRTAGKKHYESDSAEDEKRDKRREVQSSQYSRRSSRSDYGKRSSKYDISDSEEDHYRAKERTKDRYHHSESEEDDSDEDIRRRYAEKSSRTATSRSSRYRDEAEKDREYRRKHSPMYGSDSETESDSDTSALAYGEAHSHLKNHHSKDPRSTRNSISNMASKLTSSVASRLGSSYRLDDSDDERPGAHPSYAKPSQFSYQQPANAQHGQYADASLQAQINNGQIPPVLPPDWAPIPPSEMPGYVPPSTHPASTHSVPGAFPGGYPATVTPSNPYGQVPTTQSYANPPQYQYANPDPNIRYSSKNERQPYTASAHNQFVKPYSASAEPQFLDIAPGRSRGDSVGRQGRPHSLSVSSNLSVGGGGMGAGGRPPASPLLEAYKGTYQSISPMPSPIASPVGLSREEDISDMEELGGGSGSDRRRKHRHSKSRDEKKDRSSDKDRRRHRTKEENDDDGIVTISPLSRKRVTFYDPVPDAIDLKQALTHRTADTKTLIEILPNLASDDIVALRQEYKNHAKVQGKGINIAKHIKMKLGTTSFGKVCYATALGRWESEAYWANCYYQAGTSRRELLIESLTGRTSAEIREIKNSFRDARYADSLEKCMKSELKADKFRTAILLALSEQRQVDRGQVDVHLVEDDVRDLRRAVVSRDGGETAMINIIVLRSDSHLREIMRLYDHQYKTNLAKDIIKKSQNLVVCFLFFVFLL